MPSSIHSDRGPSFMSTELRQFLHSKGIGQIRTTPYNPQGNGQVERLNGTIWGAITLALRSKGLDIRCWESVLLDALHSIRSLLCTATNETPHERIFRYNRRATSGVSLPTWLLTSDKVLLKNNNRSSKYDPLVEEVELLECNPGYARIRYPNGAEDTVSTRHLAPSANTNDQSAMPVEQLCVPNTSCENDTTDPTSPTATDIPVENDNSTHSIEQLIKQQQRTRPYSLRSREI